MKEIVERFLKRNNYTFDLKDEVITVKLGFSQNVLIFIDENNNIKIKDYLTRWNPLTGLIKISSKYVPIFYSVWILIFIITFAFFIKESEYIRYLPFLILVVALAFFWGFFYIIRFEIFKKSLETIKKDDLNYQN